MLNSDCLLVGTGEQLIETNRNFHDFVFVFCRKLCIVSVRLANLLVYRVVIYRVQVRSGPAGRVLLPQLCEVGPLRCLSDEDAPDRLLSRIREDLPSFLQTIAICNVELGHPVIFVY